VAILNVKNLPDDIYNSLKRRAKTEHRSLAQEAIHLLGMALHHQKPEAGLFLVREAVTPWPSAKPTPVKSKEVHPGDTALLSESALSKEWLTPEEDAAWVDL